MNPARIAEKNGVVVLEVKPENKTLRIVYSIIMAVMVAIGIGLLWYVITQIQSPRFWLNARLMMGLLTYFFAFFILLRHWIWYTRGNEVVVVYKDIVHYYRSFALFAEGKIKRPYKKIEVIYRKDEAKEEEFDAALVDDLLTNKESAIVGFRIDDDEVVSTFLPISMEDVRKLTKMINQ